MENNARAISDIFETVSLGAPQNAVGFVLWRVMHRFQREADKVLLAQDLTHLQFTTLTLAAWMGREGNLVPQSDLARFGDIHPMQVSNVVRALEVKGMVVRAPAPRHALAKTIAVTSGGLSALRAALPLMVALQRAMFGPAGAPGGTLLDALVRIDKAGS